MRYARIPGPEASASSPASPTAGVFASAIRILYEIHDAQLLIIIIEAGHRSHIYRA